MGNTLEISKDINLVDGPTPIQINPCTAIEQQIYDNENLGLTFEEFQVHLGEVWRIIKLSRPNLTYLRYLDERVL